MTFIQTPKKCFYEEASNQWESVTFPYDSSNSYKLLATSFYDRIFTKPVDPNKDSSEDYKCMEMCELDTISGDNGKVRF